ncbi:MULTISPECIES: aminotransferase class IV [unclassified Imperialibacter]|uniref:aminotransferase class IV n=1 Tax=unclassified Imperialibacter TaxID=2629706 RepID=UPI00125857EA|nr:MULTISPECIES: aminotransferase class IV [unclassified Imperialibacter]CAD5272045.1 4-amino-4-deoxychorismate lyase [Imperialibacter sp. 89]CAD5299191.1 4-amino-4-deoxychorismate lyase [Imperialibacter sp. 75]VVT35157.1 4-amino-4-deoxychorismate lyase [Imperialibacter sp. EC-SDR9]
MCLLLESIKIANGQPQNLPWHQRRLDASRLEVFGVGLPPINLLEVLDTSQLDSTTIYKARVIYGEQLNKVEIEPYSVRPIQSIRVVEANNLDYRHKYADRSAINMLFNGKGGADEILITRNSLLTDCSYANVCFWDGSKWHTPAEPLLAGTKRASLLEKGLISERKIAVNDIKFFESVTLINAMLDPGTIVLPVSQLIC